MQSIPRFVSSQIQLPMTHARFTQDAHCHHHHNRERRPFFIESATRTFPSISEKTFPRNMSR